MDVKYACTLTFTPKLPVKRHAGEKETEPDHVVLRFDMALIGSLSIHERMVRCFVSMHVHMGTVRVSNQCDHSDEHDQ
jgi:hypothetical protein